MSEDKGMAFTAMIQEFIAPRIHAALDLDSNINDCDVTENALNREVIKTVDVTGREIYLNTKNTISFQLFNNGSVEKIYIVKWKK